MNILGSLPASDSNFGTVNKTDLQKVLRMAIVGAVGIFLAELAKGLTGLNFGTLDPAVDLVGMLLTETARRLATGQ